MPLSRLFLIYLSITQAGTSVNHTDAMQALLRCPIINKSKSITSMLLMVEVLTFSLNDWSSRWLKPMRLIPCRRISPRSGNYSISGWWKFVGLYPQAGAKYNPGYFEMGKYVELSSEGGCALCTVVSPFWLNILGFDRFCFQHWFDGTTVSFDKQNVSGNVMHNKTW